MWDGYLETESARPLLAWISDNKLPMVKIHTSGHASVGDLKRFAEAVAPKRMVPIHSFSTDKYPELFKNVAPREDSEWWVV